MKSKPTHPKWYLWLYPYLSLLRHDPKYFFRVITGRGNWAWHYEWEDIAAQAELNYEDEYKGWLARQDDKNS